MRAFLIHSSADKPFVDEVAARLGRNNIIYDVFSFTPGVDLKEEISVLLPSAGLGVFFASAAALESPWVRRELALSRRLVRDGRHLSLVTVVLDDTTIDELPTLARRYLCKRASNPQQAISIIRSQLRASASASATPSLFMGREQDLEALASRLHGRRWPLRMLCLSGLDGIGRRTLASHVLRNYLATTLDVELQLDGHDGLDRLYLQAAELAGTVTTRADLEARIAEASDTAGADFARHLASMFLSLILPNEGILIVDNGSLFTSEGAFTTPFINVMRECFKNPSFLLVLASRRRPRLRDLGELQRHIVEHPVLPLPLEKTELLLSQSFLAANIPATEAQIHELATYIDGYPPAVRLAVEQAQRYGIATIVANKGFLADYKARQFSPIVDQLATSKLQRRMLRALGSGVYITIPALARHLQIDDVQCAAVIEELSDMSLIATGDANTFFLQRPIRDAVTRSLGFLAPEEYRAGLRILKEFYWNDDTVPPYEILSAITLSAAYVNDTNFTSVIVPSTLLRAAIEAYNAREWDRAISLCKQTLKLAADRLKAREVLAKSYIRKEAWAEAAEEISLLREARYSSVRYIEGFLAWKQGDFVKAEDLFRKAMRDGDSSIQVVRDRAYCLFRLGRHANANDLLKRLPAHAWQNRYVLDLAAQIAIELKDYETAESHIASMRHLGEDYDANHRHAALYIKKRLPREAFALLEKLPTDSRFETHAMRADCLIELDRFDAAQGEIRGLKPQTSGNRDVVQGLRCKLALREGDSELARSHYTKIRRKDTIVHRALEEEIRRQERGAARKTAAANLNLLYPYLADEYNLEIADAIATDQIASSRRPHLRSSSRRSQTRIQNARGRRSRGEAS